jgi:hypothetical protein
LKITTLTIVLLEFATLVLTGPIGLIVAVPVLEVALGTGVGAALVRYFRFGWIPAIVLVALLSWIASQSL